MQIHHDAHAYKGSSATTSVEADVADLHVPTVEAALMLAARGNHVFPVHTIRCGKCTCGRTCKSPGKHPISKLAHNGHKNATTDGATIRAWFSEWPDANIGIATEASGIIVLDVDPRHGGDESLRKLEAEVGALPATVRTGSGGNHIFFQDGDKPVKGSANSFGPDYPGLDIRSKGGYVVAPPSLHMSGQRYRWLNGQTIVAFPDVLRQKLAGSKPPSQGQLAAGAVDSARACASLQTMWMIDDVLSRLGNVRRSDDQWSAQCPAHDDERNSLSVSEGETTPVVLHCHAGCKGPAIWQALGFPVLGNGGVPCDGHHDGATVYDYRDKQGTLLYQMLRRNDRDGKKTFASHRPDGAGGCIRNLNGVERVPYRSSDLAAGISEGQPIWIVEGEKDVESLRSLGFVATTNAFGAAWAWPKEWTAYFGSANRIIVLPDSDEAGREAAKQRAALLATVCKDVRLVDLAPDRTDGYDVSDWLGEGRTRDELERLVENAAQLPSADEEEDNTSKKSIFVKTLLTEFELFCDPSGVEHCTFTRNSHNETARIRSGSTKKLLKGAYYARFRTPISAQAIEEVLGILESEAVQRGIVRSVHVRFAFEDSAIWVDLGDDQWRAVRIDRDGWGVAENPAVRFRRPRGMRALPDPVKGGGLADLRPLLNLGDDVSFVLICAWLVGAVNPDIPHPVLVLYGEQGSCKTTASRILRSLLDPNTSLLRSEPKDARDLMIAAQNGWVIGLDNLSYLPAWLSDGFCRLSTGGGLSTRQLYTDDEEIIFEAMRPIMLNGIEEVAARPDLLDRAISINLPPILDSQRLTEGDLWQRFAAAQPGILGALFDAASAAMNRLPEVQNESRPLPRMADFAQWAIAAERALGFPDGSFMAAYDRNLLESNNVALDSSLVAAGIIQLMKGAPIWSGTASDLLKVLQDRAEESVVRSRSWPKNGKKLSDAVRRITTNLRKADIAVTFVRTAKTRTIDIRRIPPQCAGGGIGEVASFASPASPATSLPKTGQPGHRVPWDLSGQPPP